MSRFWGVWGGLVMWFAGGLISVSICAFAAWHDLDKRVALLQQSVTRIEQRLGTTEPVVNVVRATSGEQP